MTTLLFLAGLAALIAGAEALVRGASSLAASVGISPLVVGLTVVALGTSSPEMAVSVGAVLSGQPDIVLGNVIGSNIFNVLFILGLSALIVPLVVSRKLVRVEVPLMIALSFLVLLFAADGILSPVEGGLFVAGLFVWMWLLIRESRNADHKVEKSYADEFGKPAAGRTGWILNAALVIGGLGLLVLGSDWLVDSAVRFARVLGVSELVIGLTIIAAGTSMPEVVTSLVAAVRGERDIAVGNVVGSNIFNIMAVLGIGSLVSGTGIEVAPAVLRFDLPVMIVVAAVCLPIFFSGSRISRAEGALLLGYFAAYTVYLLAAATHHDALPAYSAVMFWFVVPLSLITVVTIALREWDRGPGRV